jgi:ABC-2 type transport system permease protein
MKIGLIRYIYRTITLAEFEIRKLLHDQTQVWIRIIQPALWLLVFGEAFTKLRAIPTGDYTYLQFMTPGVLAQSVMFVAIFYGITVVWERDLGLLNKLLSTPTPRSAIVMGKALSAGVRGIVQAVAIFVLALIIHVKISLNPIHLLGVLFVVFLLGMFFACLSMCLAALVRTRERVMGIGQAITMPLFFASNAIYPASILPTWIKAIVTINPLSYVIDAIRGLLVTNDLSKLMLDMRVIVFTTALMVMLASWSFKRIIS